MSAKGTALNTKTNASGYSIGTKVINLDTTGTGNVLAGDKILIAGDTTPYFVNVGNNDVLQGGSITLLNGLTKAIPAVKTAITVSQIDTVFNNVEYKPINEIPYQDARNIEIKKNQKSNNGLYFNYTGIMDIWLYYPTTSVWQGTKAINDKITALDKVFDIKKTFTRNNILVYIDNAYGNARDDFDGRFLGLFKVQFRTGVIQK